MDPLTRAFYELHFELAFERRRGEAFQDLFATVMTMRHPGDFQPTRPWGRLGDRKNDGYLRSTRTMFQLYAPDDLEAASTIAKIQEDFHEGLLYWRDHFDTWVFVHNGRALGPSVLRHLLELGAAHPPIRIVHWGFEELRAQVMALPVEHLERLFGPVPTSRDVQRLGLPELQPLLEQLARMPAPPETEIRPVPPEKIRWNLLSPAVATLLTAGMQRSELVARWYSSRTSFEPTRRDEVATAFALHYAAQRAEGRLPDDVFAALQAFAGGAERQSPIRQVAVLAIIAYFFEACDIFERPPGGG